MEDLGGNLGHLSPLNLPHHQLVLSSVLCSASPSLLWPSLSHCHFPPGFLGPLFSIHQSILLKSVTTVNLPKRLHGSSSIVLGEKHTVALADCGQPPPHPRLACPTLPTTHQAPVTGVLSVLERVRGFLTSEPPAILFLEHSSQLLSRLAASLLSDSSASRLSLPLPALFLGPSLYVSLFLFTGCSLSPEAGSPG